MPLVKVTSKRQITIPSALGKELGIEGGDHVEIIREGSYLVVKPVAVVDKEDAWFHQPRMAGQGARGRPGHRRRATV